MRRRMRRASHQEAEDGGRRTSEDLKRNAGGVCLAARSSCGRANSPAAHHFSGLCAVVHHEDRRPTPAWCAAVRRHRAVRRRARRGWSAAGTVSPRRQAAAHRGAPFFWPTRRGAPRGPSPDPRVVRRGAPPSAMRHRPLALNGHCRFGWKGFFLFEFVHKQRRAHRRRSGVQERTGARHEQKGATRASSLSFN